MLVDQDDGPPAVFLELRVDALHFAVGLLLQRVIRGQCAARGGGYLQETDSAAMPRILVEQRFQGVETLEDSLGKVPTLDSETDDHVESDPMTLADVRAAGGDVRQHLQPAWGPFDRDRISRHPAYAALERHGHLL